MALCRELAPLCSRPERVVTIPDGEIFVVPRAHSAAHCERVARAAILQDLLRPADVDAGAVRPAVLAFAPFWRIHVASSGWHVGLPQATGLDRKIQWVGASLGNAPRDMVHLVSARNAFPFAPKAITLGAGVAGIIVRTFEIDLAGMVPLRREPIDEGEVVLPDVPREVAEREALRVAESLSPTKDPRLAPAVRSAVFCFYPLVVVRYAHMGEDFHAVVSARTGKVVGGKHPPRIAGVAARFRRALPF